MKICVKFSARFLPNAATFDSKKYVGYHGWDDTSPVAGEYLEGGDPRMRAIFYAMGPSFKEGCKQDWIKLVDEYQEGIQYT